MSFFWSGKEVNTEFENEIEKIVFSGDLVLDVGCGKQKVHPRCLGVDAYEDYPTVNAKAYMWDMGMFTDNSIDGIVCFSALEHISKFQVMPTLAEFERVLKPGAVFAILVPDLEWVCRRFLEEPDPNWNMDLVFGDQTHDGQYHKTGFTENIFAMYFAEACKKSRITNFYRVDAYSQENLGFICRKEREWVNTESPSL